MPIPPRAVRFNAQKGLDIRAEQTPSNRAGTPVGIARARDLAAGVNVSEETIRRMVAFFNRHQQNWDPTDLTKKGSQAWLLWGGTAGRRWAEAELRKIEREQQDS